MHRHEDVWETIKPQSQAIGQVVLDREDGYAVRIVFYDTVTKSYSVEYTRRPRTEKVLATEISVKFIGLLPMELLRDTCVTWKDHAGITKIDGLATCAGHLWNRWFYVHLLGGKPENMPSRDLTTFERRIELSSFLWRNPDIKLEPNYKLNVPRKRS